MIETVVRTVGVVVLATLGLVCATGEALAQASDEQPARSFAAVKGQIPIGDVIFVTDAAGSTIRGKLAAMTDNSLEMHVNGNPQKVGAADVSRIQWQKKDSALTGVLIGGAIGAIPGIYWLIADPNECTGLCTEDYVAIGVGALIEGPSIAPSRRRSRCTTRLHDEPRRLGSLRSSSRSTGYSDWRGVRRVGRIRPNILTALQSTDQC